MRSAALSKFSDKEPAPMFKYANDLSNIRGISITDTGTGALVGVLLSGTPDYEASVESLALQVRIEYGSGQQKEIDVLMHDALHQALKVIQHEIDLCEARSATSNDQVYR
jgi:hypothetical protein